MVKTNNPFVYLDDEGLKISLPTGDVKDINSEQDLIEAIKPYGNFCLLSSSVDFPEEYTEDQDIIDLCRRL